MYIQKTMLGGFAACILALLPFGARAQTVAIAGPEALVEVLVPATVEAFSRDLGLTVRREILGNGTFAMVLVDPANQEPVVRFVVGVADTVLSIAAASGGSVDLAVVARAATEGESGAMAGVSSTALGRDGLVAVVSRENALDEITPEALAGVLSGEISNWSALGGPDAPIRVHLLEPDTDQDAFLRARLLGDRERGGDIKLHLSNSETSDAVVGDPLAIGITSFSEVGNAKALALAGSCGLSVSPGRRAIKNEDYPLSTPVMVYARTAELSGVAGKYLSYLSSEAAQGPIRQAGFIDRKPESIGLADQGERLISAIRIAGRHSPTSELRRLVEMLDGRERLSLTFRFQPKSSDLDEASLVAVRQLGAALLAGDYDGRRLTFVGFTDGVGSSERNVEVGRARARAVQAAVRDAAPGLSEDRVTLVSDAFGEAMPIACDDSDWGRHANRRVEIWID